MGPQREWKTQQEIETIARKVFSDEIEENFDKLRDGAQASINTAFALFGNKEFGIRGFVGEMQDRMMALEQGQITDRETGNHRHADNQEAAVATATQVEDVKKRLELLEQKKMVWVFRVYSWATKKNEDGKTPLAHLTAIATAAALIMHWATSHGVFSWLRKLLGIVNAALMHF